MHSRSAKRLCDLCFRNAGLYIKIGQHLGSLDYLLPKEYTKVLKVFHHTAPRSSLEDIYDVFQHELGQTPDELFESFDTEPLGMRYITCDAAMPSNAPYRSILLSV